LSLGTLICLAQLLSGTVLLILLPVRTVWSAAIALTFFGVFSAPLTIWAQTLRMRIIPPHLRGRTFALLRTMMQGGTPFGGAGAGFLLPVLGIPTMIALSAIVVGLPGLAGLRVKALRWAGHPD
jgi:MFS family permease